MTVEELITKLKTLPQGAVIVDTDGDDEEWDIELWTEPQEKLVFMRTNKG